MNIGIISDIHSNLAALDAAICELTSRGCERIICAGDIIGIGPEPDKTVGRLRQIPNLVAVVGNHDKYFTRGLPSGFPNPEQMERDEYEQQLWQQSQLSADSAEFLRSLPEAVWTKIDGVRIYISHYAKSDGYLPVHPADGEWLSEAFPADADVAVYGHDHCRSIVRHHRRLYVNPGALGCPPRGSDIARAAILTVGGTDTGRAALTDGGGISVEPIDVRYDVSAVKAEISRLDYPASGDILRIFYGSSD